MVLTAVLATCGGLAIVYFSFQVYSTFSIFLRSKNHPSKYGSWSVVTGATGDIGKALAFELAKQGQNIIAVGRNQDKLNELSQELREKYGNISVETCCIDLSDMDANAQKRYANCIQSKDVGILINNAGLAYQYTNYFHEVSIERHEQMIGVNARSPLLLTHLTIDQFLQKKKGTVMNISSAGSVLPHELHVTYSGTKSFLNKFTLDLADEYAKHGLTFQVQLPYFVSSQMSKRKPSLTCPTADSYAQWSLKQLGYSGMLSPHPMHALIFFAFSLIPTPILRKQVSQIHHAVRRKGNKKFGRG